MPKIAGKHFPYTQKGKKAAASYKKKMMMTDGEMDAMVEKRTGTKKMALARTKAKVMRRK